VPRGRGDAQETALAGLERGSDAPDARAALEAGRMSPELASPEPELLAQLREENPEALLANGFEAAFVGICRRFGQPPLALYDRRKCLAILMADGTSEDDAEEYFEFNTIGAWMGENTPCFADLDGEKKGDSGDAETR